MIMDPRNVPQRRGNLHCDESFKNCSSLMQADMAEFVERAVRERRGVDAVAGLLRLEDDGFGKIFNAVMHSAKGDWVGMAYVYSLQALIREVDAGGIADLKHLRRFMTSVLTRTRRRFETIDWKREHPLIGGDDDRVQRRRYTMHSEPALAVAVAHAVDPAERLVRQELLPKLLSGARSLGYVGCRVLSVYRRFEIANGSTHGAYVYLARMAVLDANDEIVGFRRGLPTANGDRPEPALHRRVRRLHKEAVVRLAGIARDLGFDAPVDE